MKAFQKDDKLPGCNFSYVYEGDLVALQMFEDHRRLKVFINKGVACVTPNCNHVGTRLIFSLDQQGGKHWDVYTDDAVLMAVDHIVPKCNGGDNELSNLQPMCIVCKSFKKTQEMTLDELALFIIEDKKNKKLKEIAKREAKQKRRLELQK